MIKKTNRTADKGNIEMTIEEVFFRTFGIERSLKNWKMRADFLNVSKEAVASAVYPEITAEKLLQLLCIVINEYNRNGYTFYLDSTNVKELKEDILDALMGCIDASCDLFEPEVKQIQQLFKD